MLLAARGDFGREHAVDLEELELDGVAAGIGRRIDESEGARQIAVVVGRGFGNEDRRALHAGSWALTVFKSDMAKKRLTMAEPTQPFFIVSSGRSGTAMLHKALAAEPGVEMHHEYMVQITQKLAVQRYLGLMSPADTHKTVCDVYGAAVRYSDADHWGDSSNKLSWLIPELAAALPDAKFVHLVRDGRKVAGSYFRKLGDECYDDRSNAAMQAHHDGAAPAPPPEKKYWWPVPRHDDPAAAAFRAFDQFERIAWHWAEINRVILEELARLPAERQMFVTLEDLHASPQAVQGLYDFLNLHYRDEAFAAFGRPHNVNRPEDRLLDDAERAKFDAIAGTMMRRLGYADSAEYVVNY
jgi:hypothetical protein